MFPSHKIWGESNDGKFQFVSLTEDLLNDSLEVIRQGFFPYESVSIATDVAKNPEAVEELIQLCRDTAKDGVSVVAVEKETGTVASVAFNKIQKKCESNEMGYFEKFAQTYCKHSSSKALMKFMLTMDAKCDLFERYKIDVILEIMFLGTLPNYRNKSLAKSLCEVSFECAEYLSKKDSTRRVQLVSSLPTSFITQRIFSQLGFDFLVEVSYNEFTYEGKTFSEKIGPESPSTFLIAKRVT